VIYLTTHDIPLAVALGIALGVAQIGWQIARKRPIDTMQWLSLFLIVASGTATLLTRDRRGEYAAMRTIGIRRRRARGLPIPA
jgi:intracellular septation protein A